MNGAAQLSDTFRTIPDTLACWAERTPRGPAVVVPGQPVITYAILWGHVHNFATSLNRLGIDRADRVVLVLPEEPALALALLGTMSAAIAAPLGAALTPRELGDALRGLGAAAAIGLAPLPAALVAWHASPSSGGSPALEVKRHSAHA